jgi:methyl-accepting chemotaxis protein
MVTENISNKFKKEINISKNKKKKGQNYKKTGILSIILGIILPILVYLIEYAWKKLGDTSLLAININTWITVSATGILIIIIILSFRFLNGKNLFYLLFSVICLIVFLVIIITVINTESHFNVGVMLITYSFIVPIAYGLILLFISYMNEPIASSLILTENIQQGNFTQKSDLIDKFSTRSDELGQFAHSFGYMYNYLIELLSKNLALTNQIANAVEEISASAEEITSSSENIASSQQQISKGASEQVTIITTTQNQVQKLLNGMKEIQNKIEQISHISDLIRNLSNQTNMLALNAAIEAARAGEAGRGFNVVADQVRKLAEESRKAVGSTEKMLIDIKNIAHIQESSTIEMIRNIDTIASVAEETSASTEESAAAAEEQASSMEQLNSTAENLAFQTNELKLMLEKIKL